MLRSHQERSQRQMGGSRSRLRVSRGPSRGEHRAKRSAKRWVARFTNCGNVLRRYPARNGVKSTCPVNATAGNPSSTALSQDRFIDPWRASQDHWRCAWLSAGGCTAPLSHRSRRTRRGTELLLPDSRTRYRLSGWRPTLIGKSPNGYRLETSRMRQSQHSRFSQWSVRGPSRFRRTAFRRPRVPIASPGGSPLQAHWQSRADTRATGRYRRAAGDR